MKLAVCAGVLFAMTGLARADTIRLRNGGSLEGVILKDEEGSLVVRVKYATVTISRNDVESIEKTPPAPTAAAPAARLARWEKCLETIASRPWAGSLRQIPATVIDKGVLKNVPYMSHKSGDVEFNLYGDPDDPAGLEIGLYREALKAGSLRKECLTVMTALLGNPRDAEALASLHLSPGKTELGGLVFEITPETAEDSYGGWWITVYDPTLLAEARASDEELKKITLTEEELAREEASERERIQKEGALRTKSGAKAPDAPANFGFNPYYYEKHDVQHARPLVGVRPEAIRRFYVRGYHRPKGVYSRPGGIRR
jgi:hypothetical protein